MSGGIVAQALGPDVRNAVAVRVGAGGTGFPGEVNSQAAPRTEPRPLPYEHHSKRRVQAFGDFVANGDPPLLDDHDGSESPVERIEPLERGLEHGPGVLLD